MRQRGFDSRPSHEKLRVSLDTSVRFLNALVRFESGRGDESPVLFELERAMTRCHSERESAMTWTGAIAS